tara:strand:+ start:6131 stop:7003 length:873 start_codon:yes stop_codon:yes gene_type:complete
MKKIIVYNNWGDTPEQWSTRLSKQSPNGRTWKNIQLVSNIEEADTVVICDGVPSLKKDEFQEFLKKPKIFLQREPEHVQGPLRINPNKVDKFITYDTMHTYSDWWLDYDYNYLTDLKYEDMKKDEKNPICIITPKAFTLGQRQRLNFLKKAQSLINIEFYGKSGLSSLFENYRGPVEMPGKSTRDKSRLFNYHHSFSLENGKRRNFFTRPQESLLSWTMPIYWGCPNLEDFLPEGSYRYIDIESLITKEKLEHLTRPVTTEEIRAIKEGRDLVLNKYNFFPYIEEILENM